MISKVVKSMWTNPNGKMGFCFRVYYKNKQGWKADRCVMYTDDKNLPLTVLNYILNADKCETTYYPDNKAGSMKGLKRELYTMA